MTDRYGITCNGSPIGAANITPLSGLAHAEFAPSAGYSAIRYHALEAGARLRETREWSVAAGDFAEAFAREWTGGRLALTDAEGTELAVASVVLIDREDRTPVVVVDARPDPARVAAYLRTIERDDGGTSRPAA